MTDSEPASLGEVLREGERLGLRYVRDLRHPPSEVFAALTESEHLRAWMPCDLVGPRVVGAPLVARFWPDFVAKYEMKDADLPAQILVWDPPRVFEWKWDADVLRFELEATSFGTRLVFTTWLVDPSVPPHKTAAGYHFCLQCLEQLIEADHIEVPLLDADTAPLEAIYEKRLR